MKRALRNIYPINKNKITYSTFKHMIEKDLVGYTEAEWWWYNMNIYAVRTVSNIYKELTDIEVSQEKKEMKQFLILIIDLALS